MTLVHIITLNHAWVLNHLLLNMVAGSQDKGAFPGIEGMIELDVDDVFTAAFQDIWIDLTVCMVALNTILRPTANDDHFNLKS